MTINRIQQLSQTVYELRLRGLSERQQIRELQQANKELKTSLNALQREIEALREDSTLSNVEAVCFDARQYEALSVQRAESKDTSSYFLELQKQLRPGGLLYRWQR